VVGRDPEFRQRSSNDRGSDPAATARKVHDGQRRSAVGPLASERHFEHYALVSDRDLTPLPAPVQAAAQVLDIGDVMWPLAGAEHTIESLATAHRLVLGPDIRDYQPDGRSSRSHGAASSRTARTTLVEDVERRLMHSGPGRCPATGYS
jgi:hypothetical protein